MAATASPSGSGALAIDPAEFRRNARLAAVAGFSGTAVEWYDYFLYGSAAAVVFPKLFFSGFGETAGLLASLATFGVAFFLRPLGGLIFGHFGDRVGRKRMLAVTLMLMGGGTFLIGCLPTGGQVGVLAPILLILLRMLQGVGLGGEWAGAALVVVEHAPQRQRGIYGCAMQIGVPAGQLMSSGLLAAFSTLPDDQFYSWGWRMPFLLSIVLVALGLYIRFQLKETPYFKRLSEERQQARLPIAEVLRSAKKPTVLLIFVQAGSTIAYFTLTVFSLIYVTRYLHLPESWALTGVLLGAGVEILTQPFFAWLSDRVGRRPVYAFGTAFLLLYAFPFFWLLDTGHEGLVLLSIVLGLAIGHSATGALHGPLYAEQYPTRLRYSGASLAYQLSSVVAGAPAAFVAAWLVDATGSGKAVSLYVLVGCAVSLVCVWLLKEGRRIDMST